MANLYLFCILLSIKGRIEKIDILLVHLILRDLQTLTEALEVDDLTFSQETDDVVYIGIVAETQDIVIGDAGFLFCGKVFGQITDHIAFDCHGCGVIRPTGSRSGIDTCGMIDEISVETRGFDLILTEIAGKLMHQCANHFQMSEFLCTYRWV